MTAERRELLDFGLQLAAAAQDAILPHYQRCAVSLKADGSEVTVADRDAETAIRTRIADRYPQHAILGEEFGGERQAGASRQWVIDPIDGTTWFALGMPLFGTLIALLEDGEPVVGVIHFPVLRETVYAARGLGCWFTASGSAHARPTTDAASLVDSRFRSAHAEATSVQVRSVARLDQAFVSASGVHGSDIQPTAGHAWPLTRLIRGAGKFRSCSDCLQYALLCRGNLHVAMDTIMQPWDIAALIPCIEEAGGVATNLAGVRENLVHGGNLLASCDRALHAEVLGLLR